MTATPSARKVLLTRSGSDWNFVQNPARWFTLANDGMKTASTWSLSASTCPMNTFDARQASSMESASPASTTARVVSPLTTTVRPASSKKVRQSVPYLWNRSARGMPTVRTGCAASGAFSMVNLGSLRGDLSGSCGDEG